MVPSMMLLANTEVDLKLMTVYGHMCVFDNNVCRPGSLWFWSKMLNQGLASLAKLMNLLHHQGSNTLKSVLEGGGGEWFNFQAPPRIYLGWDDDAEEDDPTPSTPLPPSPSLATCFCFCELCDFESWESWSLVPRKASTETTSLFFASGIVSSPPKKLSDWKKKLPEFSPSLFVSPSSPPCLLFFSLSLRQNR